MSVPKISIIIPVYKAESYLHRCVDSILTQTFTDFELLLIDDGSPDKSGEICDAYAQRDSRVRVIHKENGGVSSARQCGMDNARGEYSIHADPDDWVEPTMLEELYNKALADNADMVICDYFVNFTLSEIEKYHNQRPSSLESEIVLRELFQQLHGSCWNKLVRHSCYKLYNVSFPQNVSFCEDLYVNAALLKNKIKVSYLPKAFYHYVQDVNPNSLIKKYTIETYYHDVNLFRIFLELLSTTSISLKVKEWGIELLVGRAYRSRVFSSFQFKQNFISYSSEIIRITSIPINKRIMYYLSCKGYYKIALILQDLLTQK